jgi:hypothetical protein
MRVDAVIARQVPPVRPPGNRRRAEAPGPRGDALYGSAVSEPTPSFFARVWLAWACFFRVIFDPAFARSLQQPAAAALPPAEVERPKLEEPAKAAEPAREDTSALELLALLQREGRLVDFLQQDVASFSDADVGVAARVVHEGCRKALREHVAIVPVRDEAEGAKLTVPAGYDPGAVKLVGDVRGKAPYSGVLRHRGWRAEKLSLPPAVGGHDARVLAPAEVEL